MENLLRQVDGDIDEYGRVTKYITYIFGNDTPMNFVSSGMNDFFIRGLTDDLDPVFDIPWHKARTKKDRKRYLDKYHDLIETEPKRYERCSDGYCLYPVGYCVALYEDELIEVYDIAATVIQRYVRGVITRAKVGVYNPHCDIGQTFILKMYIAT